MFVLYKNATKNNNKVRKINNYNRMPFCVKNILRKKFAFQKRICTI